ncbi:hypothetical protein FACS1894181_00110 [Bacteroidia bacterium]|nr:hypothetical protein FACS1894181_00110 [Bacteroidia bacterium]
MATYQIHINEQTPLGKSIIALLRSAKGIVSLKLITEHTAAKGKSNLYKSLESGLGDVKEILEGKQEKQTLKEFLE